MDFMRRVIWYLLGVSIGVFFITGWLSERDDFSCTYFPDARVKDNILRKKINIDENAKVLLKSIDFDTVKLKDFIKNGDVIFKKSNTKLDSCKTYFIEDKNTYAIFENCDSLVNILELKSKE